MIARIKTTAAEQIRHTLKELDMFIKPAVDDASSYKLIVWRLNEALLALAPEIANNADQWLEEGTSAEGEWGHIAYESPQHGLCLRTTKRLKAGAKITRVVTRYERPDYPYPTYQTTAFRNPDHARRWFTTITRIPR